MQINHDIIQKAVELLREGDVVAIPTETVYGLAGDAGNESAIRKIFELKNRPIDHPVIVHIAGAQQLENWAIEIPDVAYQLAEKFWPGPLTFILKKAPHVSMLITGGQATIGLRSPNHPMTHEILTLFGGGVAAPSANRFSQISPTRAEHVAGYFGHQLSLIVDGGSCQVGIESTILDLTSEQPTILRPGMISCEQLESATGKKVLENRGHHAPRVSGDMPVHYAPLTRTQIKRSDEIDQLTVNDKKIILIGFSKRPQFSQSFVMPKDPVDYAKMIYETLHNADQLRADLIIIEELPAESAWNAIRDRLVRASV